MRMAESRRQCEFPTRLRRAADAYIVRRGRGKAIVAGYPWLADWARDTFITLRGLCIADGRLADARYGICADSDGLHSAGAPGVQLTRMQGGRLGSHAENREAGRSPGAVAQRA